MVVLVDRGVLLLNQIHTTWKNVWSSYSYLFIHKDATYTRTTADLAIMRSQNLNYKA